jgi:hypothetical protein
LVAFKTSGQQNSLFTVAFDDAFVTLPEASSLAAGAGALAALAGVARRRR